MVSIVFNCDLDLAKTLSDLEDEIFSTSWDPIWIREKINNEQVIYWIKQKKKEVVGYLAIQFSGNDVEILGLGVLKEYRRKGYAFELMTSMMEYFDEGVNEYLVNHYSSSMGRNNTFGFFIEHAFSTILEVGGLFSFIIPNTLLTQESYFELRECILNQKIVNLTLFNYLVFKNAVVEAIVFVIKRINPNKRSKILLVDFDNRKMTSTTKLVKQSIYETTNKKSFLVNLDEEKIQIKKVI